MDRMLTHRDAETSGRSANGSEPNGMRGSVLSQYRLAYSWQSVQDTATIHLCYRSSKENLGTYKLW